MFPNYTDPYQPKKGYHKLIITVYTMSPRYGYHHKTSQILNKTAQQSCDFVSLQMTVVAANISYSLTQKVWISLDFY